MKDFPLKGFSSKLMVASKSINNIPTQYLSYSRNARIFDGGIGSRRGKQLLTNSTLGTNNKGGFTMGGELYQITNSKIYQINQTTGVQTEKADLGYNARTDILVYDYITESFSSLRAETHSYTYLSGEVGRIGFNYGLQEIVLYYSDGTVRDTIPLTNHNDTGLYKPSIKIMNSGTTNITSSGTGTSDSGGYVLQDGQYVNLSPAILTGDISVQVGYYVIANNSKAIIGSNGQYIKVFDGTSIIQPNAPTNTGILEYCRGYSFLAGGNTLYISAPITLANPRNAYDFTGTGSQTITFDTSITGLKATMNGLYIFTEDQVHSLNANSLQNIAGSATFISTPLGDSSGPINNTCIAGNGDKIFWISKNLQVQTINYLQYSTDSVIGDLSARPVISIKEFLNTLNLNQDTAYAFYNENDKTIQFHIRSAGSPINDYVLVYDFINDTWNVDTNKNYNYVVKIDDKYYGFSDVNSSIYLDDTGYSDNGTPIEFRIRTNTILIGPNQSIFGGFYIKGGIGNLTDINIQVNIDGDNVFLDTIAGNSYILDYQGEIAGDVIGEIIGGGLTYFPKLNPFDKRADQGRIYRMGNRIQYEITSNSQIQEFSLEMIGTTATQCIFTDTKNMF